MPQCVLLLRLCLLAKEPAEETLAADGQLYLLTVLQRLVQHPDNILDVIRLLLHVVEVDTLNKLRVAWLLLQTKTSTAQTVNESAAVYF